MAKVFLDTNIFIDSLGRKPLTREQLDSQEVVVSPLSFHIFSYIEKVKIPSVILSKALKDIVIINLTQQILDKSLEGPTKDLEDNLQLHSAIEGNCDYFFTNDRKLLNMKYFGKMKIINNLSE